MPEMVALWDVLCAKAAKHELGKDEEKLYKKWGKAMALLASDPQHPGLHNHEKVRLSATGKEEP
ncbi:MAG TPA: hypothetical protein VMV90_06620 [Rectinemataceae bacterium]|nr:hypothetical protein [Rectinemataceae bacterium]